MEEETVICGNCGREVPKTLYCIYCGSALTRREAEPRKPARPPEEPAKLRAEPLVPAPKMERMPEPIISPASPPPRPRVQPTMAREAEVDPEIAELMENLRNNYIWKIRLCGVLCDEGVSENVFNSLFEEYINQLNQLNQVRNEKVAYYRVEFEEKKEALDEARKKLEELKVRVAVGQLSNAELTAQTPELDRRIRRLTS
jgi:hypothetical protein